MLIDNDFDLRQEMQRELTPGEKLLWTGRPKTGVVFRSSDFLLIPFSLFWFGFAIFWESGAVSGGAPFFFMIWGLPFIAIGLYMTVGRFFYDAMLRKKTIYGVTTMRVLIKSGVFKTTVNSLNISTLQNLGLDEKADGSGTIKLDADNSPSFGGIPLRGSRDSKQAPQIEFIQNVRNVYNLILQQQHT